ncbi:MAG: hypothetical protein MJB14_21970, partial [Spirochaetes bacterium]|nr:hypothetical protein [Spirochaetota bacterium]
IFEKTESEEKEEEELIEDQSQKEDSSMAATQDEPVQTTEHEHEMAEIEEFESEEKQPDETTITETEEHTETETAEEKSTESVSQEEEPVELENMEDMIYTFWNDFIKDLNKKNQEAVLSYFAEQILLTEENLYISRAEMAETLDFWISEYYQQIEHNYIVDSSQIHEERYAITIIFEKDLPFFLPIANNLLKFEISTTDNIFLIDTIVTEKTEEAN